MSKGVLEPEDIADEILRLLKDGSVGLNNLVHEVLKKFPSVTWLQMSQALGMISDEDLLRTAVVTRFPK